MKNCGFNNEDLTQIGLKRKTFKPIAKAFFAFRFFFACFAMVCLKVERMGYFKIKQKALEGM